MIGSDTFNHENLYGFGLSFCFLLNKNKKEMIQEHIGKRGMNVHASFLFGLLLHNSDYGFAGLAKQWYAPRIMLASLLIGF